ncbi:MFS transporter [Haloferula sp.]|uniref:MFS transporter n=1 Tax=Haloferula sp. TaxID=2497595 RepID=UPI00329CC143
METHSPSTIPDGERVPLSRKILWGFGGLADNFMFNTLTALGTLVYVNHFKLSPALAGLALGLPRLIDAITDPWIGNMSDNAKSRWGRRRPFMFFGVIFCALLLPMLWTLPGIETAGNPWYSNIPFFYIVVVGSLLALAYTLYVVPYTALGFEMTPNYDERTRVIVWRMYIGLGGSLAAGWLFRLAAADYFPDLGAGAFWVSVGVAAIVLVAGMIPVFGCRENLEIEKQPPIKLLPAIKYTMTNKPFVILFITYITIIVALFAAQSIAPLLIQHYVFGGDEKQVGTFQGLLMSLAVALSYVSMIAISFISARTSKQIAMRIGLSLVLVGTVVNYFAIDPRWPWAMYLAGAITFLGMQGCWLMIDSMVADVCDDDELRSGRRREGMFSAVKGFALKAAQAITFGIGGYMATFAGYDPEIVGSTGLDESTATRMKFFLIGFQAIGLFISIILISKYPISRARAEETRRLLDEKAAGRNGNELVK